MYRAQSLRLLVLALSATAAITASAGERRESTTRYSWTASDGARQASARERIIVEDGRTQTIVEVETPAGNRAHLIQRFDEKRKGFVATLEDPVSGWRAELRTGFASLPASLEPVTEQRLAEIFRTIFENPDTEVAFYNELRCCDGLELVHQGSRAAQTDPIEKLSTLLEDQPKDVEVTFPASTVEAIRLLSALVGGEPGPPLVAFTPVIVLSARALDHLDQAERDADPYRALEWTAAEPELLPDKITDTPPIDE